MMAWPIVAYSLSKMIISEAPRLTEDRDKIREAILFVMSLADNLSQYDIAKTLFLADRSHLNQHGRPITFDNYVAMEHGPVPSFAYDVLKPAADDAAPTAETLPWVSTPDPVHPNINRFTRLRAPDLSFLSDTDRSALRSAWETVRGLTFQQLRRVTHEDPAYIEAWARRGGKKAAAMKLALLIEVEGEALASDLIYMSALA